MTNQEAFDKVVRGLRAQGRPSLEGAHQCMYRNAEGLKCAAGMLIPDSEYKPSMENVPIRFLIQSDKLPSLNTLNIDLIASLQTAHDNEVPDEGWLERMEVRYAKIAYDYSLVVPKV